MNEKKDVWQGTLALMVLRTVAVLGPQHSYGIAKRIEQVSAEMPASTGRLGEALNLPDSHSLPAKAGSHADLKGILLGRSPILCTRAPVRQGRTGIQTTRAPRGERDMRGKPLDPCALTRL